MTPEITRHGPNDTRPSTAERWKVDPERSALTFTLRHIIVHEIRGQFLRWGGWLSLDRQHPSLSEVEVWVDLTSIETDSAERDDHVRSPEFLDVARFPRAVFKSTSVEPSDERVLVRGNLDLHGVSNPVELEVTIGPTRVEGEAARADYDARGIIDRQAFGLHWNQDLDIGGVVVGDRIELRAHVEAIRLPDAFSDTLPRG